MLSTLLPFEQKIYTPKKIIPHLLLDIIHIHFHAHRALTPSYPHSSRRRVPYLYLVRTVGLGTMPKYIFVH
jgi:hypothetical protein